MCRWLQGGLNAPAGSRLWGPMTTALRVYQHGGTFLDQQVTQGTALISVGRESGTTARLFFCSTKTAGWLSGEVNPHYLGLFRFLKSYF